MSTDPLDAGTLRINGVTGTALHAVLDESRTSLVMRETISGASTVEITVQDPLPDRPLLRSGLVSQAAKLVLDNAAFSLAAVRKTGDQLVMTFEDLAVASLRRRSGVRKAAAGSVTRSGYCAGLIRSEEPWIAVSAAPGAATKVEIGRGTDGSTASSGTAGGASTDFYLGPGATSTATKKTQTDAAKRLAAENSWDAITRIMGDIQWRVYAYRGRVWLAPDSWLLRQGTPIPLSESTPGVDLIDLDWDAGKPAGTAKVTVRPGAVPVHPGLPVSLSGMGPGDGAWLVDEITRTMGASTTVVSLLRAEPALPEPEQTGVGDAGALGFDTARLPDGSVSGSDGASTGIATSGIMEQFVQATLTARGKPYTWGASGPGTFDCSGLMQWAAARVGVSFPKPVTAQYARIKAAGKLITITQAVGIRGAVLIRVGRGGTNHIAVSLGNGHTMEAMSNADGCRIGNANNRGWTHGGIIPGIEPETTRRVEAI